MAAKKVALFVDVDCLHQHLRNLHNRSLDPKLLVESAQAHGELVRTAAIADWSDLPEDLKPGLAEQGLEVVDLTRALRSREASGRRREIFRGTVDLEVLARIVELLFTDGAPEVDTFVLATADDTAARIAGVVRERFQKRVVGLGVEGVGCELFQGAVDAYEVLPMPAIEPQDPESLSRLVPLLEDLERRKRYLNFKYIRETVVRRLDLPERSFDAAEGILADAIACGVLLKQKIDDKYNPGQLFTAYSLNRESPYFHQWGSGEPAPEHDELDEEPAAKAGQAPALPSLGARSSSSEAKDKGKEREKRGKARDKERGKERERDKEREPERIERERDDPEPPQVDGDERGDGDRGGRRRGRGRGRGESDNGGGGGQGQAGGKRGRRRRGRGRTSGVAEEKIKLAAGGGGKKRRGGGPKNHQQDRVGRVYEAPSRFLSDEKERPQLSDDDIDEDRILKARGDL